MDCTWHWMLQKAVKDTCDQVKDLCVSSFKVTMLLHILNTEIKSKCLFLEF